MYKYEIHYYRTDEEDVVDTNLDEFFKELFDLYDKYNISISHEDGHGGFILEQNSETNRTWILYADVAPYLGYNDAYTELIKN